MSKFRIVSLGLFFAFVGAGSVRADSASAFRHPFLDPKGAKFREALWSPARFTDPAQHDPSQFRYIVHKLDAPTLFMRWGVSPWAHRLLDHPEEIAANPRICASAINQEFPSTFYGSIGFILNVPAVNIGPMSPHDLSTTGTTNVKDGLSYLRNLVAKYPRVLSPDDLIQETQRENRHWNEIDIAGTVPGDAWHGGRDSKVTVSGILLECKHAGNLFHGSIQSGVIQLTEADTAESADAEVQAIGDCLKDYDNKYKKDFLHFLESLYRKQRLPFVIFRQ